MDGRPAKHVPDRFEIAALRERVQAEAAAG
jgi:hypothetical protein